MSDHPAVVATLRAAGCVFAEAEAQLLVAAARSPAELDAMVARRAAGHPLEQVVGWAEFCGLRVVVEPGVFVPRRRTEFLVEQAVALARRQARRPAVAEARAVVVDLCCGSGAVGLAVAAALGDAELHAADVDPASVRCAARNIGDRGTVYKGDLFEPLPAELRHRVDVLAANVPYVPTGELALMPAEARLHEPVRSLDGGGDGLDVLRRVAAAAPEWLAPGGSMLTETSERQAPEALDVLARSGLEARVVADEELQATVVIGNRPG